jgi:hypothetical protein
MCELSSLNTLHHGRGSLFNAARPSSGYRAEEAIFHQLSSNNQVTCIVTEVDSSCAPSKPRKSGNNNTEACNPQVDHASASQTTGYISTRGRAPSMGAQMKSAFVSAPTSIVVVLTCFRPPAIRSTHTHLSIRLRPASCTTPPSSPPTPSSTPPPPSTPRPQDTLLQANAAFYAAMRARDTRAMTEDIWLLQSDTIALGLPLRGVVVGAEEVAAAWSAWFAVRGNAAGPDVVRVVSSEVRGGSGWVVCVAGPSGGSASGLGMGRVGAAGGGEGSEREGGNSIVGGEMVATNIFQQKNGEWRMVYHSSSPVLHADE